MPDIEGIGDAVTGGLAARAIEPGAGEAQGRVDERICLNCGCALTGDYCHCCGQRAKVHRTLGAFWHELLHGVLHFEGKIWNTLPLLSWRPGDLTRRYIEGERAKFVSPIALFLFSIFILFAIASASGSFASPDLSKVQTELAAEIAKQEAAIAKLQAERDTVLRRGGTTAALDARIRDLQAENAVSRGMQRGDIRRIAKTKVNAPGWLERPIRQAAANPDLLLYKLRTNAYKFSWLLIPLSVPFLWLLFPFSRRFHLYDHTVFVTYSLSFMSLLLIAAILLALAGLPALAGFAMLVPPFHMYRQLKGTYGLSRTSALIRTVLLMSFAIVALTLFALAVAGLGLAD